MSAVSPLFLGVDVGTTSAKAVLADERGRTVAEASAGYGLSRPRPMWAEQWPEVWLEGLAKAVRRVLETDDVSAKNVAVLTVSSLYGGAGIPVDGGYEPLHPCVIWLDRRARAESERIARQVPLDRLLEITGNGVDSYFGFTKMLWLRDRAPEVWSRTRYLLPPNAFLVHRLTGELAVDHSAAGNIGGVYDIRTRRWSDEACELVGLDITKFPQELVSSSTQVGVLHADGSELTGLPVGTPVCAGGIDAAVATLSAGVLGPGRHVAMMGTSMCWGFVHEASPTAPGLVSMPYVLEPERLTYTFGGAATAGAVPAWFLEEFGGGPAPTGPGAPEVASFEDLDARAACVAAGSDGLVVLPYFAGERSPIWDADARGTITGLRLDHSAQHIYRACLEGVAYALRHNVEEGRAAGYVFDDDLHVVGGAARSRVWMQILSSVLGKRIVATDGGEAAYGDAMLGAVGIGATDAAGLARWGAAAEHRAAFSPRPDEQETYDALYPHYLGLYEDLAARFAGLASVSDQRRTLQRVEPH